MTKALVLGGGGPVGIAWESGLLAGLDAGGVDVSNADFIMGTSAGSFVGAQLALGMSPAKIAEPDLTGATKVTAAAGPAPDLTVLITKLLEAASGTRPGDEVRAEMGAHALKASTISEDQFMSLFAPALGGVDGPWPKKPYACTAVNAADGKFVAWKKEHGIGLARAVASSCAVPGIYPPITFQGARYMDGGARSMTNSDVAKGYDLVVVVAVVLRGMPAFIADVFSKRFERELNELRESGSHVEVVVPDEEACNAFGMNLMDATKRGASAEAGFRQGKHEAARWKSFWK